MLGQRLYRSGQRLAFGKANSQLSPCRFFKRYQSNQSHGSAPPAAPQQVSQPTEIRTYDDLVRLSNQMPAQSPEPKPRGKNPPVVPILLVSLIGIPPLVYYYWQYRDEHMKAKKYAMLKDIQARAAKQG